MICCVLDPVEVLGKGTFGIVYTAKLDNKKTVVVLKRLKLSDLTERDFIRCMEIVWNVNHPNVVPLSGYFTTVDEKLMLYDHLSSGSVFELLHGKNGVGHVDWETRLRIVIGAAKGVSQIHAQSGCKLVHGNIKASNIFLNSQSYGYVSDLGFANMTSTWFPSFARCYATEVWSNQNVSQSSDVYSFGILLLELLTRKSPVQSPSGHEAVDLVQWVNSVNPKVWKTKVLDRDLLLSPTIKVTMVNMLKIGLICVAKSLEKRPTMSKIVYMIEDICTMSTRNQKSMNHVSAETEMDRLIYFGFGNHTFDLGDLSEASAEVIGKGTYGTTYKLILENGIVISVKRLRGIIVTKQQLLQHIEDVGRTQHQNVAEIKAYYYSKDETHLIYEYYAQGSVSTMLQGKSGSDKIYLDWKTRLKIAVDAARGIAHIHTRFGGKLVHGNIRTSNIFVNEQKHGVVADVGLANVVHPVRSVTSKEGDYAPEFLESRISQACDVYSFGVVLLELVSGKSSQPVMYSIEDIPLVRWFASVPREQWTDIVIDLLLLRYANAEEAIVLVLQLAMDCISKDPESRPQMVDIAQRLEEISWSEKGS